MSIAEKLTAIAENQQKIAMQYFKTTVIGDGTKQIRFAVPFAPDVVDIQCASGCINSSSNTFYTLGFDRRSPSNHCGKYGYCASQGGSPATGLLSIAKVLEFSSYENGIFTWKADGLPAFWSPLISYTVMAVKYPGKGTRQMVEEEIRRLPMEVPSGNSGTVTYNKTQIESAFAGDEFEMLTAERSNWTFVKA